MITGHVTEDGVPVITMHIAGWIGRRLLTQVSTAT